jgi:sugar/nucleoside kinase (ribokinase family)
LLFVNEEESRMLTGISDVLESAKVLNKAGARTIVVKLGAKGCMVLSNGEVFSAPAFEIDVLDTTGAGDCFAGGYLAAIQRGLSPKEAARVGNAVGALSVRRVGAVAGLLSWEETQEWMDRTKVRG